MTTSPFATLPGAVLSDQLSPETDLSTCLSVPPIPLHYGDPAGEQWSLEAGNGLVDRSDLGIVTVSGVDRQTWLTSLASQIVTGMGPGDSRELLILDPQGHVEYAAAVVDDGQTTFLIVEGAEADPLAQWLDSMRFALRVEVAVRPDLRVLGTVMPAGKDAPVVEGELACWDDPWPGVVEGGTAYFQGAHPGRHRRAQLHLLPEDSLGAALEAWLALPGHRASGLNAWEAVRIAAWRPRHGFDTDDRTIPAEVDWLRTAVHIAKGCYRGQESVARVLNLGRPPRRLVALQLDGSLGELPAAGTAIMRGVRQVGVVTSVARHAEEGPIALALVARNVPADEVFDLDGVAAAQEVIVPLEGKAEASPQERPGAGLARSELRRPNMRGSASGGLSPR